MVGNPVDIFQKQEIEKSVKYKSFFFFGKMMNYWM